MEREKFSSFTTVGSMEMIASVGSYTSVKICDLSSGDIIATLKGHTGETYRVCFSLCGALLACGSLNGSIAVWDCETWTRMQTFTGHASAVLSVSFSRAGDKILSTSHDGTVRVWSLVSNMEELKITPGSTNTICARFINNDDTIIVTYDGMIKIYDAHTGELKRSLADHPSHLCCIDCSQDGSMLVSGSSDYEVVLWDVASGSVLRELLGHTRAVSQVCFNADASRVVSSSWDYTARIWDVSTGECLLAITNQSFVLSCCFSEDGSKVITASNDGAVKVWDSYTGEELRTLRCHHYYVAYRPSVSGSYI